MKRNIEPLARERAMREEDFIVSKTDVKGRITYTNRIFMEFAGYSESELLGSQHNIVRHPDMPRAVFNHMWETLQAGQEFFGYVKNLCSDGCYYWVFANVTPTLNGRGETIGYYSVRRKPRADAVALLAPVYTDMLRKEQEAGPKGAVQASRVLLEQCFLSRGLTYEEFVLAL